MKPLGRRIPSDFEHVYAYPLRSLALEIPPAVERSLGLPWWWRQHDQGSEGSCVGFGCSAMQSITNHHQRLVQTGRDITYRYDSRWLYGEAQLIDEWDDTPPAEGTSVKAGCEILRAVGHRRVQGGVAAPPNPAHGIEVYRWAEIIDEIRAAIYFGMAVAIGVNWYSNFDSPVTVDGELWIGRGGLGFVRGGHCTTLYRMSDRRQAFRMINSWGSAYPPVWVPYPLLERLISELGEIAVVSDR